MYENIKENIKNTAELSSSELIIESIEEKTSTTL